MGWVDVADVARAHIYAYENPKAGGRRFLTCVDTVPLWTEVATWLKELFPDFPVNTTAPEAGAGIRMTMDNSGLKEFGFAFTPLKDSLKAQGDSLIALGLAPAK